jgi:hypothetical protein
LAPIGYIGWAASPSRVTRPGPEGPEDPQDGSGSRSTIGYSPIRGAPVISAGTSSQPNFQSANHGSTSSSRPCRLQSARFQPAPSSAAHPGRLTSATQLSSARPRRSARREMG